MVNRKPLVRTEFMHLRVAPEDKAAFQAAAKREGVSLSEFVVMAAWCVTRAKEREREK